MPTAGEPAAYDAQLIPVSTTTCEIAYTAGMSSGTSYNLTPLVLSD
jgi:hypothetical protein